MLRRVILAGVSTCVLGLTFGFSQLANATWFDAATGQPVHVAPWSKEGPIQNGGLGANQATYGGRNLYWDTQCNTWKDSATGSEVHVAPWSKEGPIQNGGLGANQATYGGRNLYWQPCPPPTQTSMSGGYLGGEIAKNSGRVRSTETRDATGVITNQFTDSGDPLGVGIVAGYNFRPWNNNIVVGPFASFDFLKQTINHTFTGGQFLGTTTNWIATLGAKGGYVVTPGVYLYGLAGASWLNHSLNVNFATAASSTVTTPGFTLGFGAEYQPSSWALFGNPVSVFLQYQHTWWGTANFNTPASSPLFNYGFKREDDTIRLGGNVYLSR